jgi:Holliday junction resolvasome RuvABC endonuclease subunit
MGMMSNIRVLCFDPAGNSFGVAMLELQDGKISIPMTHVIEPPADWHIDQKNNYVAHCAAAIIGIEKPSVVVSEDPFGIGWSAKRLGNLLGAIKAEAWTNIEWQGVSEMRRGVLGDGYGGSDKIVSAEWLVQYPFLPSAKNLIRKLIDNGNKDGKIGYDVLDAILHGVYYLVDKGLVIPVHKPEKKKRKKKGIIDESAN